MSNINFVLYFDLQLVCRETKPSMRRLKAQTLNFARGGKSFRNCYVHVKPYWLIHFLYTLLAIVKVMWNIMQHTALWSLICSWILISMHLQNAFGNLCLSPNKELSMGEASGEPLFRAIDGPTRTKETWVNISKQPDVYKVTNWVTICLGLTCFIVVVKVN